jgi:hypothetical protein
MTEVVPDIDPTDLISAIPGQAVGTVVQAVGVGVIGVVAVKVAM